jgi:exodeoxyribonuclease VII large subunit
MVSCTRRHVDHSRARLAAAAGRLPRLTDLMAIATQRLDLASGRLASALAANVAAHRHELTSASAALRPHLLLRTVEVKARALDALGRRLEPLIQRRLRLAADRLAMLEQLRVARNPDGPLARGFARVEHDGGRLARSATDLKSGEAVDLIFHDGRRAAVVGGGGPPAPRRTAAPATADTQGRLL